MKIAIVDYETSEIYEEIAEPTLTHINVFGHSEVVNIQGKEYIVITKLFNNDEQSFNLLVSEPET